MKSSKSSTPPLEAADTELEDLEILLLLDGISRRYGYDFRDYAPAPVRECVLKLARREGAKTVSALQERVLRDPMAMERFLHLLAFQDSPSYPDPALLRSFRRDIVPMLRTYPFIRIWHVGCASPLQIYATAILLREEGVGAKSLIYATDMDREALRAAEDGTFSKKELDQAARKYRLSGGADCFRDYWRVDGNEARFPRALRKNITFAQHNLATDNSFNRFNVIFCHHALRWFKAPLQEKVHRTLYESLEMFGLLALGQKESLHLTPHEDCYAAVKSKHHVYRKFK